MYGIVNCDTIRKARAWLDDRAVDYRFHDYRAGGIEAERLQAWIEKLGWEVLLNKASTTSARFPTRTGRGSMPPKPGR